MQVVMRFSLQTKLEIVMFLGFNELAAHRDALNSLFVSISSRILTSPQPPSQSNIFCAVIAVRNVSLVLAAVIQSH